MEGFSKKSFKQEKQFFHKRSFKIQVLCTLLALKILTDKILRKWSINGWKIPQRPFVQNFRKIGQAFAEQLKNLTPKNLLLRKTGENATLHKNGMFPKQTNKTRTITLA